jgi:hypothetical protein
LKGASRHPGTDTARYYGTLMSVTGILLLLLLLVVVVRDMACPRQYEPPLVTRLERDVTNLTPLWCALQAFDG